VRNVRCHSGTATTGRSDVFVSDGVEQAPVPSPLGVGRGEGLAETKPSRRERKCRETAEEGREYGTIHEKPPETRLRDELAAQLEVERGMEKTCRVEERSSRMEIVWYTPALFAKSP